MNAPRVGYVWIRLFLQLDFEYSGGVHQSRDEENPRQNTNRASEALGVGGWGLEVGGGGLGWGVGGDARKVRGDARRVEGDARKVRGDARRVGGDTRISRWGCCEDFRVGVTRG